MTYDFVFSGIPNSRFKLSKFPCNIPPLYLIEVQPTQRSKWPNLWQDLLQGVWELLEVNLASFQKAQPQDLVAHKVCKPRMKIECNLVLQLQEIECRPR